MPGTRAISRIAHKAYVVAGAGLIALATSSCGTATTATERAQAGTPETGLVQAEAATTEPAAPASVSSAASQLDI